MPPKKMMRKMNLPTSGPVMNSRHVSLHGAIVAYDEHTVKCLTTTGVTPCVDCFRIAAECRAPWTLVDYLLKLNPTESETLIEEGKSLLANFYRDEPEMVSKVLQLGAHVNTCRLPPVNNYSEQQTALAMALQDSNTTMEYIRELLSTAERVGELINGAKSCDKYGQTFDILFNKDNKQSYYCIMECAKIIYYSEFNGRDEFALVRSAIRYALNIIDTAFYSITDCAYELIDPKTVQEVQDKTMQWLSTLEFFFEHGPNSKDRKLIGSSEPNVFTLPVRYSQRDVEQLISSTCGRIIHDWHKLRNFLPESFLVFLLNLGYLRETPHVYTLPLNHSEACTAAWSSCYIISLFISRIPNGDYDDFDDAMSLIRLVLRHGQFRLVKSEDPRVPLSQLAKTLSVMNERYYTASPFERLGIVFTTNDAPEQFPYGLLDPSLSEQILPGHSLAKLTDKYDQHQCIRYRCCYLRFAEELVQLGSHVGRFSPDIFGFSREMKNMQAFSDEQLELFRRNFLQMAVPDVIAISIFTGKLLLLRKFLPHCPVPPLALLQFQVVSNRSHWAMFPILAEFGPLPHGSDMYKAIKALEGMPEPFKRVFDEMHRAPLSLRALCRAQVRINLGRIAAQPDQPSLPELVRETFPFCGVEDFVLMIPREPINVVRCANKEMLRDVVAHVNENFSQREDADVRYDID